MPATLPTRHTEFGAGGKGSGIRHKAVAAKNTQG